MLGLVVLLIGCAPAPTPTPLPPTRAPATAAPAAQPTAPPTAPPTALPATATPKPTPVATTAAQPPTVGGAVTLTWFGQATFVLAASGFKALLDPTGPGTGYTIAPLAGVDVVTVSHEHSDHNAVNLATGSPLVLRGLAGSDWAKVDQTVKGVRIRAVGTYHDNTQGSARGKNAVFVFELGGLRVAHLGDLGHPLTSEQLQAIGPVEVVMIPVGGTYTVDGPTAAQVVEQLNPRVVIPMHFKTADVSASLAGRLAEVEAFTAALGGKATVVQAGQTITLDPGKLPSGRTVMVMKYK